MKKWGVYLVLIAAVIFFGRSDRSGEDVGNLLPVQLITAEWTEGKLRLRTDTGHTGIGDNVAQALEDMNEAASGAIFLDTADYLLVKKNTVPMLEELTGYLRPSCAVCQFTGNVELSDAVCYLEYHIPELTLAMYEAGERKLPLLTSEEGRMKLVQ